LEIFFSCLIFLRVVQRVDVTSSSWPWP